MTTITVELSPEVATILGTILKERQSVASSDALGQLDYGLSLYYENKLFHLGEELTWQGPDLDDVMAAHPSVQEVKA